MVFLSLLQQQQLEEKVEAQQRLDVNKAFKSGDLMVNLLPPHASPSVRIIQTPSGDFETRYTVEEGKDFTIRLFADVSWSSLSPLQQQQLQEQVEAQQKKDTNKKFKGGDLMVNLLPHTMPGVRLVQSSCGKIQTWYTVGEGATITIQPTQWGIAPEWSSSAPERPKRWDGKFAKIGPNGQPIIGRVNMIKPQPTGHPDMMHLGRFNSLEQDVKLDLQNARKQRLPQPVQNLQHTPKTKVEKKPTPEDLNKISRAQKEERLEQFEQLKNQVSALREDVLTSPDQQTKLTNVKGCLTLLSNNLDKSSFPLFLTEIQKKYNALKSEETIALRAAHPAQNIPSYIQSPQALGEEQQALKEEARRRINAEKEKDKSHTERPNANPNPIIEEQQPIEDVKGKDKEKKEAYTFQSPLKHSILEDLQETSTEDSSYQGVKISREQLMNFVAFLRAAEKQERSSEEITLKDLGYYYDVSAGKGSHTKVKLGRGTKPLIFSQRDDLTVEQMRDLKTALIFKGLITRND